jgi:hypothetical protein
LIEGLTLLGLGREDFGISDECMPTDFPAVKPSEKRFISRTKEGCPGAHISSKLGRFFASLDGDLDGTVWAWNLEITRESVARDRSDATSDMILSKS